MYVVHRTVINFALFKEIYNTRNMIYSNSLFKCEIENEQYSNANRVAIRNESAIEENI